MHGAGDTAVAPAAPGPLVTVIAAVLCCNHGHRGCRAGAAALSRRNSIFLPPLERPRAPCKVLCVEKVRGDLSSWPLSHTRSGDVQHDPERVLSTSQPQRLGSASQETGKFQEKGVRRSPPPLSAWRAQLEREGRRK